MKLVNIAIREQTASSRPEDTSRKVKEDLMANFTAEKC